MNTATHGTTRVVKKIDPQAPGARRWAAAYGEKLGCVRYRLDPQRQRRLTTVEIVVDEAPTLNSVLVGAPRRLVWNPTLTIGRGGRGLWACGQAAFEPVHMSTGRL